MRRFIFICVALIAFLATNASGTYQPTDQLQTHCFVQADLPSISPATVFENNDQPVMQNYVLMPVEKQKTIVPGFYAVFKYPDYGLKSNDANMSFNRLCSINRHTYNSSNFETLKYNKLPYHVQRE